MLKSHDIGELALARPMITCSLSRVSAPNTILAMSTESWARLGLGDRAHERPVRVADVAVDHLEVALVDRQVDRLAQRAAAVVERAARVGQLHEVAEVLDRGVAPAVVEVVDERRAVGRHEDHVRVADLDAPGRVAGALGEDPRRRGLDDRAAHAAREADPLALDVGAGAAEDLGRLGEVDDLDADLLEEGVGVLPRSARGPRSR